MTRTSHLYQREGTRFYQKPRAEHVERIRPHVAPVWRHGGEKGRERDGVSLAFGIAGPLGGLHDGLLAQW